MPKTGYRIYWCFRPFILSAMVTLEIMFMTTDKPKTVKTET